jgi:hypothetical protein
MMDSLKERLARPVTELSSTLRKFGPMFVECWSTGYSTRTAQISLRIDLIAFAAWQFGINTHTHSTCLISAVRT